MHGMPCSALNHCFGSDPSDVSTDQLPSQGPDGSSRCSRTDPGGHDPPGAEPVLSQPEPKPCGGGGGGKVVVEYSQSDWRCESLTSARSAHRHLDRHGSEHSHWLPTGEGELFGSRNSSVSQSSEEYLDDDGGPRWALQYPLIPRPSIIIRQPGSEWQETAADRWEYQETEDGRLSGMPPTSNRRDPGLSLSAGRRSAMAEPDYLEADCDELIRPKKLINPVKTSRNHQDLHRELMMNQKMGLAPQNKPELQKVLEKRKREQVLKAQKEEQEAHKKKSDLEIELMKRQQKLEQLDLDQQKNEEEQENTPEFVKMKSNLRRTKQETDGEERTT
ncbi:unnamed protein product [Merluccius merluccius]